MSGHTYAYTILVGQEIVGPATEMTVFLRNNIQCVINVLDQSIHPAIICGILFEQRTHLLQKLKLMNFQLIKLYAEEIEFDSANHIPHCDA